MSAKKDKPGQKIEGKLMQELRLADGAVIKKGSRVTGQALSVQRPARITLQFTQLQDGDHTIPLNVSLRALAAPQSVFQAGLPADASTSDQSNEWVTQQVGGDYVFRGRGYVASNEGRVGRWAGGGVWGRLSEGENCPDTPDNPEEQALWIFSTTACGAYGFDDLTIASRGNEAPLGQITLESAKEAQVRGGSGWLLVVNPAAKPDGKGP